MESDVVALPEDHIETRVLSKYAPGAICAVIASYKGATMRYLKEHGAKVIYGVEPQDWATLIATKNLRDVKLDNPMVWWEIDRAALVPWATDVSSKVRLYDVGTDGASLAPRPRGPGIVGDVADVPAMNVMEWLGSRWFDFMVLNCEGAEYALIPWLVRRTKVLLVQYHKGHIPLAQMTVVSHFTHMEFVGSGWYLYT